MDVGEFWRWSTEGQDLVHAVLADRAARCSQCGTREDEWLTVGPDGKPVRVKPSPYEAEVRRCPGCAETRGAENRYEREGGKLDSSTYTTLRRSAR